MREKTCLKWLKTAIGVEYHQLHHFLTEAPWSDLKINERHLENCEYIKQAFELTPDSLSVSWLPSVHDMGLIDYFCFYSSKSVSRLTNFLYPKSIQ